MENSLIIRKRKYGDCQKHRFHFGNKLRSFETLKLGEIGMRRISKTSLTIAVSNQRSLQLCLCSYIMCTIQEPSHLFLACESSKDLDNPSNTFK